MGLLERWRARLRQLVGDRPEALSNAWRLTKAARRGRAVLVCQMGKVGSTAISEALDKHEAVEPFHAHRINRRNVSDVCRAYRRRGQRPPPEAGRYFGWVLPLFRRAPVITIVREPIARNVSAWFQNRGDADVARYLERYPHYVPSEWFDRELAPTLGADVYSVPFDHDRGWVRIEHPRHPTLVIRSDLPDPEKSRAVNDHLGVRVEIRRANVGADKDYADGYQAARKKFEHPPELLDRILTTRYARHFFTEAERVASRERWGPDTSTAADT